MTCEEFAEITEKTKEAIRTTGFPNYTLSELNAIVKHMKECESCLEMVKEGSEKCVRLNPRAAILATAIALRDSMRLDAARMVDKEL